MNALQHGDFTVLAEDYARFRPDYAPGVLDGLIGLLPAPAASCDAVDVGAGTGIWTRMLSARGFRSVTAVEPNAAMRAKGAEHPQNGGIGWYEGRAEHTGLPTQSADLVSMASSFHWADFDTAVAEFIRLLRPRGCFVALWNPRFLQGNPLLADIEAHLDTLRSGMKRVSSGRSGVTDTLTERLGGRAEFADVVYLESQHTIRFTPEAYLGVWRSVNDLRVQLGPELFNRFLDFVERRVAGVAEISAIYMTRAWTARKR